MNEQGAFQVRESIWGTTPQGFYLQAKQHQQIIKVLQQEANGNLWDALRRYNGTGRQADRYAERVAVEVIRIAVL